MSSSGGPATTVLIFIGVGMYFAPDTVAARVRGVVADAMKPGQMAVRRLTDLVRENAVQMTSSSERTRQREIDALQEQLREEQARTIALQVQLARFADIQVRDDSLPDSVRALPRLTSISLIDATVLGESLAERWRKGKLLDRGEVNGVRESELVVKSNHALVDVGRDGKLSPEDSLLLGRCVIGKIERVGRWTSTVLLLTDSGYRGRAQLVHPTDTGFVFGAKGILEGQGEALCCLKGIKSSEAISVGDAVYTATRDGQMTPLFYGRVVEASLGPSDTEWKVLVEPVSLPNDLSAVQILRTSVNPERLSAGL